VTSSPRARSRASVVGDTPLRLTILGMIFIPTFAFGAAQLSAAWLDEATVQQCRAKAWPAHQAQAHERFCASYVSAGR
jgi:hypothetical protein